MTIGHTPGIRRELGTEPYIAFPRRQAATPRAVLIAKPTWRLSRPSCSLQAAFCCHAPRYRSVCGQPKTPNAPSGSIRLHCKSTKQRMHAAWADPRKRPPPPPLCYVPRPFRVKTRVPPISDGIKTVSARRNPSPRLCRHCGFRADSRERLSLRVSRYLDFRL